MSTQNLVGAPTFAAASLVAPASSRHYRASRREAGAARNGSTDSFGRRVANEPRKLRRQELVGAPTFLIWSEVAG
jgi:hypothetical protein